MAERTYGERDSSERVYGEVHVSLEEDQVAIDCDAELRGMVCRRLVRGVANMR